MAGTGLAMCGSEVIIQPSGGELRRVPLVLERYRLGRGVTNEIAFPEDARLSREHLIIECVSGKWVVRDLGSSNGTKLNGKRLDQPVRLKDGDQVSAGSLFLVFRTDDEATLRAGDLAVGTPGARDLKTLSTDLEAALRVTASPDALRGSHLQALLRAGKELAAYSELDALFNLVLDLAVDAVGAGRGALVARVNGSFSVLASHGDCPSVSRMVMERVLAGESLLVEDTLRDEELAHRQSIMASNVRSILAVPLQTDTAVLGIVYVDTPYHVRRFSEEDLSVLTVLSNIAAVRIDHARLLEVERVEKQLARELDQAAEIQARLLPAQAPECSGLDLAGHNAACRKVGGDYYDFWSYPDGRVVLLIADVAGKGMPAALLMSNLQACVHVLFEQPGELVPRVSRLNRYIATNTLPHSYITFFIAILDPCEKKIAYCNAGHNPPILSRQDGAQEYLDATGMVLGLLPNTPYTEGSCAFTTGDALLLYSDGATEACKPGTDEEFGEHRLSAVLTRNPSRSAAEIIQNILSDVQTFTSGVAPTDDITLLVAKSI